MAHCLEGEGFWRKQPHILQPGVSPAKEGIACAPQHLSCQWEESVPHPAPRKQADARETVRSVDKVWKGGTECRRTSTVMSQLRPRAGITSVKQLPPTQCLGMESLSCGENLWKTHMHTAKKQPKNNKGSHVVIRTFSLWLSHWDRHAIWPTFCTRPLHWKHFFNFLNNLYLPVFVICSCNFHSWWRTTTFFTFAPALLTLYTFIDCIVKPHCTVCLLFAYLR